MNCKKCGNMLASTDTFCKNCGEPVTPTPVTQVETNNNVTPNPIGGMSFMTPPAEPNIEQNGQPTGAETAEPEIASIQEPTQPVNPVSNINNGNMVDQQVNQTVAGNQANINQASMSMGQSINDQVGGTTINEQSIVPQQQTAVAPQQTSIQPMPNTLQSNNITQTQSTGTPIQDEPTEPVKKKTSPILVVVLVIVLLAVVGFEVIYFAKPFDKKNNRENNSQEVLTPQEDNNYANWMNYLLEQNITNITLERTTEDGSNNKSVDLTTDDLNAIFIKMGEYKLVKNYVEGIGFTGSDKLTITYTKNDSDFNITINDGVIMANNETTNDSELLQEFEKSEYVIENEDLMNEKEILYIYILKNFDNAIYDEYLLEE